MTTRVLPVEEWSKLAQSDFGPCLERLNPEAVTVIVAEDNSGEVIGCWSLIHFAHVEGLWVAPAHRKRGRVLVRLWNAMRALAETRGIQSVYTGALTEDVERLLMSRHAYPLPPMFALPLEALRS